ncbi:MAG TPA: carboxypeptidase regulatory-like domain-containing protein [Candidatus Acidoferrum sp.]|nr:carboxypeptidase regulatory-like domain-containing protein [Candidatus Acidoferrum sp.]
MKSTYLMLPIAAVLIHCMAHYESQGPAARAAERPASSRSTFAADTATDAELVGKVLLEGQAPGNHAINMAADPECVKSHSGPATSEEIVVGSENALANVVVYVSEGLGARTFDPPKEPATIEQKGCLYHAHVIALEAGQKLLVKNDDPTTHNIHPLPANNREWNQSQAQGVPPIEATFGRQEVAIPVKCNIHPWMKGYIAVFKHPYFAVTDKDGKFILKGLPAGTYTITAWQEKLGNLTQKVTVAPKEEKTVEFVFKALAGN